MDDTVHVLLLHELHHSLEIADVHLHETIIGLVFYILEIRKVTRIRELIEVDDPVVRILVDEKAHHVRPYEAGPAGDDDSAFHLSSKYAMHKARLSFQ